MNCACKYNQVSGRNLGKFRKISVNKISPLFAKFLSKIAHMIEANSSKTDDKQNVHTALRLFQNVKYQIFSLEI